METPICVADAKTLVDYIHDIKRWIYNGQLRLVVPACSRCNEPSEDVSLAKQHPAAEQVEQIYQKSKETKSAPKESIRPKPFGKPAKIEYPPFDINPLLAKNFLARLKTWKEEDVASEQRAFFEEKENHGAVSFQQTSEQYTPWKDLEIEEEKPQVVEDRPTTWAEALRRKQNLANGIVENLHAPKGPGKPKLVAKAAGTEPSPWKIKKDAPKISAKDVPANLRPLMSCAPWRLHESIDRNDSNELFLLSDDSELRKVAQKLNITVRSTRELGVLVAAKAKRPELDTFGDLEREFGVRTRSKQTNGEFQRHNTDKDDLTRHEENMNDSISSDVTAKTDNSHVIDEEVNAESVQHAGELSSKVGKNETGQSATDDSLVQEPSMSLVEGNVSDKSAFHESSPNSIDASPLHMHGANGKETGNLLETKGQGIAEATPDATCSSLSDEAATLAKSPPKQVGTNAAVPITSRASMQTQLPSVQAEHESEDSDEDVVVFVPQPKRSSVQKKPTQQSSRPSTPLTQPQQQKLVDQSLRPSPPVAQPQVKLPSRGRNAMVVSHSHPQPTAAPTVIDPDSFGRSFAVNPNPSPRTLHNPRSHHRPRPSVENTLFHQGPRGSPRQNPSRISPSRQSNTNSPRISPAPKPKDEAVGSQSSHAQRTSPQKRSKALETGATGPRGRGPNHANPGVQLPIQQKSLNARMVESEEFVPRSAFTDAKLETIDTPQATGTTGEQDFLPRTANSAVQIKPEASESARDDSDDFVPRSSMHALLAKQQTPKPRVFEPNEFIPRNATPPSQYQQRVHKDDAIEPRASMPDVQYVLKSGSTRAATRGRGRLWIPS